MNKFERNIQTLKRVAAKSAETIVTNLFCTAVVIFPRGSKIDEPEVINTGDGHTSVVQLPYGIVYFPQGITAQTNIDRQFAVVHDFSPRRNLDGRGEVRFIGGNFIHLDHPDKPVPIGRNGARAMYTRRNPRDFTADDLARLNGETTK